MSKTETQIEVPIEGATTVEGDQSVRQAILITGMHRSGTSAAAGLCFYMGCEIPGNVIPGAFDNPKGFFENVAYVAFNDRALKQIGSAYDEPVSITSEQLQALRELGTVDELAKLLEGELGDAPLVVLKDPRICRLAPIWIEALERTGRRVSTLHPLRHPLEVASSLSKRNGFSQTQGLLLWLDHVVAAERASRHRPRSFILYDELMRDWRSCSAQIARDLSIIWPKSTARAEADLDAFLVDDLRHHVQGDDNFSRDSALHDLVARVWSSLSRLAGNPTNAVVSNELNDIRVDLDGAEALYGGYVAASQRLLQIRFDRINELERHAAHMDYVASGLSTERDAVVADVSRLTDDLAAVSSQRDAALAETSDVVGKLMEMSAERDTLDADHRALELRQQHVLSELHAASSTLQHTQAHLDSVLNSVSWRLSTPLRTIGRLLPSSLRNGINRGVRALNRRLRQSTTLIDALPVERSKQSDVVPVAQMSARNQSTTAAAIRSSGLFDPAFYEGRLEAEAGNIDAVVHYLNEGERRGLRPSERFDPNFYRERYSDVASVVPNLLVHYARHGRTEGRTGSPAAASMPFLGELPSNTRRTVLVIAHEASRTGAPILAWNIAERFRNTHNVAVLLMRGGEFVPVFERACDVLIGPLGDAAAFDPVEARFAIREILRRLDIDFCIANSVETRNFAVELERNDVPVVALVHEFSTYYRPIGMLHDLYETASKIVFPARIVRDVSLAEYEALRRRTSEILPQGPSVVPPIGIEQPTASALRSSDAEQALKAKLRPAGMADAFLVVGMGTVQQRKGVDLFIAAAAAARRAAPDRQFRFLWIGHGYKPDRDLQYSVYLQAQIELSGLGDCIEMMENVEDLEPVYDAMDALMLSSRLDPLPNVAIDAAMRGIPVVCFEGASGMADILSAHPVLTELVVPHLDSTNAGLELAALASDEPRRVRIGQALAEHAATVFDMGTYVGQLADLGEKAIAERAQRKADREILKREPSAFDAAFYTGEVLPKLTEDEALDHYLAGSRRALGAPPRPYAYLRRPQAGFNPRAYADHHMQGNDDGRDPLVHFIESGRPAGPWTRPVIRPGDPRPSDATPLRAAVHGHFHYPDLLPDFLARLGKNRSRFDLVLTTDTEAGATRMRRDAAAFSNGTVNVRTVANAGRDIGPFLGSSNAEFLHDYDVVGHFHGKKSLHTQGVDPTYGDRWREFLWEHLVGGRFAMADLVIERFAADPALGLVFPADPNLVGWDGSRAAAEALAGRLGLDAPLPDAFDFPNGTMFWARTKTLKPLFDLGLQPADYPAEPLPNDGTILHAIERLIPSVVTASGFTLAATQVAGVVR